MNADCEGMVTEDELRRAVAAKVCVNDFQLVGYDVRHASDNPLGFMGDHLRITVTITMKNKTETVDLFAKIMPSKILAQKDYAEKTRAYYKEIELFKTLFVDMQKATTSQTSKWRPECYYTRDWDFLIQEDLSVQGYSMLPERTLMQANHVKSVMKSLARMHAASYIFEEKINMGKATTKSTKLDSISGRIYIKDLYPNLIFESECTDEPNHVGYTFWEVGISSQLAIIDLLPGYSSEQKEIIKKKFPDVMRKAYSLAKPSEKYRNVMLHADLWNNNVLFRHDDRGEVCGSLLVDFQMTRYCPPAQDVIMFQYISQDKASQTQNEAVMCDYYYQCLREELEMEGLSIEQILSPKEFSSSFEFYRTYAAINTINFLQLGYVSPDVMAEFLTDPSVYDRIMLEDRSELLAKSYQKDDLYHQRMTEAMDELIAIFNLDNSS